MEETETFGDIAPIPPGNESVTYGDIDPDLGKKRISKGDLMTDLSMDFGLDSNFHSDYGFLAPVPDRQKIVYGDISPVLGKKQKMLHLDLGKVGLSVRSYNCLRRAGCMTVNDVLHLGRTGLWKARHMNRKILEEVQSCFANIGFRI